MADDDQKPGTLRARAGIAPRGPKDRAGSPLPPRAPKPPRKPRPDAADAPARSLARPGLSTSARLSPALNVVVGAVRKAGRGLLKDFGEVQNLQASVKGPGDFVSEADRKAEDLLRAELLRARPAFGFLGEEGGGSGTKDWEYRWVVDPLDGTTNFLHGIPHWAISVGIEKRLTDTTTEVVAGVIYNPAADEMFWAEKGAGAYLNDRRIRVSARRDMLEALFATGIPFAKVQRKAEFSATLSALMPQVAGIRRFGSAALDLAWVAAGRYDGFWELGLNRWDIAAGLILVKEAGGFLSDPDGADPYLNGHVVAANPYLFAPLRDAVKQGMAAAR
jgi:myo-inositol-1(or 4)-monophosphatase